VVLEPEANLFEIINALFVSRRFARRLDGWQQQCDQHADDGNDDEELHQRKA